MSLRPATKRRNSRARSGVPTIQGWSGIGSTISDLEALALTASLEPIVEAAGLYNPNNDSARLRWGATFLRRRSMAGRQDVVCAQTASSCIDSTTADLPAFSADRVCRQATTLARSNRP